MNTQFKDTEGRADALHPYVGVNFTTGGLKGSNKKLASDVAYASVKDLWFESKVGGVKKETKLRG
jgi:hypothetical protein